MGFNNGHIGQSRGFKSGFGSGGFNGGNINNSPVNTVAPVISGTQVVGSTLTSTTGTWTGFPTYTYQWYRGASLISGATSSTYTLVQADAGNTSNITCQVTATNVVGSTIATSNTLAQILDLDANAFLTAASISDSTEKNAINSLTLDLKTANIWTNMKVVYPFVGGTSTTHKWNLVNPLDTNAAFRLTFSGGWTHSSTGALANGTNSYANTFATKTIFTNNNLGCQGAFMNAQSGTTIRHEFGIQTTGAFFSLRSDDLAGNNTFYNGITSSKASSAIMQNSGFIASSRIANNDYKTIIQDGSIILNTTNDVTAYHTASFYIGNTNSLQSGYSNREFRFYFLSNPLSSAELTALRTAVVNFQTTLGRNV